MKYVLGLDSGMELFSPEASAARHEALNAWLEESRQVASKPSTSGWYEETPRDRWTLSPGVNFTKQTINGYFTMAAAGDTRFLSILKREMRVADAHLDGECRKIESMLSQSPMEILPYPTGARKNVRGVAAVGDMKVARDIASWCADQILDPDINIARVIRYGFWSRMDSAGGVQVLSDPSRTSSIGPYAFSEKLRSLDPIPNERFRYLPNSTMLCVQPGEDVSVSALVPIDKFGPSLMMFLFDQGVPSPARRGIMRPCMTPWLTKRFGLEYWARDVEIGGVFRKAKFPSGDKVRQAELQQALGTMGSGGVVAFPDGTDVDFVLAAKSAELPHNALITFCDQSMSKAILGSTQTSDIQRGAGSKASAGVHLEIVERFAESYASEICQAIREQLLKPLVARNFGQEKADAFTPKPSIRLKSYADLKDMADGVKSLVAAGFDDDIPKSWMHESLGIPVADDDEPVLHVGAPPPGMPGGAPTAIGGEPSAAPSPKPGAPAPKIAPGDHAGDQEPPEPPQEHRAVLPFTHGPVRTLAKVEADAVKAAQNAGKPLLAKYVHLIEQTKRDGGDLGHLAQRVRLHASMANEGKQATADAIAAVLLEAQLRGFVSERRVAK